MNASKILQWAISAALAFIIGVTSFTAKEIWDLEKRLTAMENRGDPGAAAAATLADKLNRLDKYVDRLEDRHEKRLDKLEGSWRAAKWTPPKEP